jgi:hypothetical protein
VRRRDRRLLAQLELELQVLLLLLLKAPPLPLDLAPGLAPLGFHVLPVALDRAIQPTTRLRGRQPGEGRHEEKRSR